MRRVILCGVMASVALCAPPTVARASDASVRDVVAKEATRQVKEDARFIKAMQHLGTKKGLKKASAAAGRQGASVKRFHDRLRAEQADTPTVRHARVKMLNALNLYVTGLRKLQHAIRQALHSGGSNGGDRAR